VGGVAEAILDIVMDPGNPVPRKNLDSKKVLSKTHEDYPFVKIHVLVLKFYTIL
jgi:hypothetical protein